MNNQNNHHDDAALEKRLHDALAPEASSQDMTHRIFEKTRDRLPMQSGAVVRTPSWTYPRWWGIARIAAAVLIVGSLAWFLLSDSQTSMQESTARTLSLEELDTELAQLAGLLGPTSLEPEQTAWTLDSTQVTWVSETPLDTELELLIDESGWTIDEISSSEPTNGAG